MTERHPLDAAVASLASCAYSDSLVVLDRRKLREVLGEDSEKVGYLPDEKQCEAFICGADDGEVPAKLLADFPRTQAYLETFW